MIIYDHSVSSIVITQPGGPPAAQAHVVHPQIKIFKYNLVTKSEHHLSAVLQSGSPLTTFWCWAQATLYQVGAVARL